MPNKDLSFHEAPAKPGSEGWLFSEQQQKLSHFRPAMATVQAQWVSVRTFSWVPPRPLEPMMTQRWMLRHNALKPLGALLYSTKSVFKGISLDRKLV